MDIIEDKNNLEKEGSLIRQIKLDLIRHLHCNETKKLASLTSSEDDKKIIASLKRIDKLNRAKAKIARSLQ